MPPERANAAARRSPLTKAASRHVFGDNIRDIALARSDDLGRTFSEPIRVREDGWQIDGCPHTGPSLAVDSNGAIHIGWYTAATERAGLHYAFSTDGGITFMDGRHLISDVPIAQARVAGGANDDVWVVWEDPLADSVRAGSAGDANTLMSFSGFSPAIAASAVTRSLAWQNGSTIQASVARGHP